MCDTGKLKEKNGSVKICTELKSDSSNCYPFSARSMAGERTSSIVTLPDPSFPTVSTQAAAAPGTVTEFKSLEGISLPEKPRVSLAYFNVNAAGDLFDADHEYVAFRTSCEIFNSL
jgi:hypothetical protein